MQLVLSDNNSILVSNVQLTTAACDVLWLSFYGAIRYASSVYAVVVCVRL